MARSKSSYIAASLGLRVGGAGADIALESAQVVLMSPRLELLPDLIGTGRFCLRVFRQNVAIALGFKLLFLGLAAQNLATLWLAVGADMGATLVGYLQRPETASRPMSKPLGQEDVSGQSDNVQRTTPMW